VLLAMVLIQKPEANARRRKKNGVRSSHSATYPQIGHTSAEVTAHETIISSSSASSSSSSSSSSSYPSNFSLN
jgi:hypothetical protein